MNARRILVLRHSRGPLGGLALVLLCCTVYLPGFFTIPPVDRDESRFAQASRQMFESVALPPTQRDAELHAGGLAVPMVGGKPRLNKPPLIYWLQAGSAAVFTGGNPLQDAIWMYRVPSLLAGVVIVLATWRVGCSMFDARVGWVGACLLAVSPVFVWEAHQARADMVMVAWTVLAMGQLWEIWRRRGATGRSPVSNGPDARGVEDESHWTSSSGTLWSAVLLWVFVALGVMTKGPITPMVVVLAASWLSVFSRDWRWLGATRPLLGLLIVAAAVAPWVYAVAQRVGFSNYWRIVYDEVFARAGSAKEGHWGPPGYHIVLLVVLFWPGSLLTGLSLGRAWRRGLVSRSGREDGEEGEARLTAPWHTRLRRAPAYVAGLRATGRPEAFLLAWMVPSWVVFELIGTKLPHYTMPLYPAVALITARGLMAWGSLRAEQRRRAVTGGWLWLVVGVALFATVGAGVVFSIGGPSAWVAVILLPIAGILSVAMVAELKRGDLPAVQRWSVPVAVLLLVSFLAAAAPGFFGMTSHAQRWAEELADGEPVTWVGLKEDSLVWFGRGRPGYTEPDELGAWFEANPEGVAVVSVYAADSYLSRPEELWPVEYLLGYHYTKGRLDKLALVKRLPE